MISTIIGLMIIASLAVIAIVIGGSPREIKEAEELENLRLEMEIQKFRQELDEFVGVEND